MEAKSLLIFLKPAHFTHFLTYLARGHARLQISTACVFLNGYQVTPRIILYPLGTDVVANLEKSNPLLFALPPIK